MLGMLLIAVLQPQHWDIGSILKAIVIIAAAAAVVYVGLRYFEITIPPVLVKVFWIVVVAIACIVGLDIILSL